MSVISEREKNFFNNTLLRHCRLGYVNETNISKLHKEKFLDPYDFESLGTCESCLMGKMTKTPFIRHGERTTELLGLIHIDVCGPMINSGQRWILLLHHVY